MFEASRECEEDIKKYLDIRSIINPIYYENMSIEKVHIIVNQVKINEKPIKNRIKEILLDQRFNSLFTDEKRMKLEEYTSKDLEYFSQSNFLDSQLVLFNEATSIYQEISSDLSFKIKKELLNWQLTFAS